MHQRLSSRLSSFRVKFMTESGLTDSSQGLCRQPAVQGNRTKHRLSQITFASGGEIVEGETSCEQQTSLLVLLFAGVKPNCVWVGLWAFQRLVFGWPAHYVIGKTCERQIIFSQESKKIPSVGLAVWSQSFVDRMQSYPCTAH